MRTRHLVASLIALAAAAVGNAAVPSPVGSADGRYIVQALTLAAAHRDLDRVGAKSERSLAIINAVSTHLNPRQLAQLRKSVGVRVFEDRSLVTEQSLLSLLSPVTSPVVMTV